MADKLTIRVRVIDLEDGQEQTVSQFVIDDKAQVTFENAADKQLSVSIKDATEQDSPLCQGNTPAPSFQVDAGDSKKLMVCDDTEWTEFKYTATVEDALPEDPIVIIEKSKAALNLVSAIVVGFLVGAVLAVVIMKLWTRKAPAQG